ncbi:alanine dehydrogenase [uncultured Kocuria sp.]|uniref:alanine dehydrogenase n=1 Tax=uncultured Kocuria sp. TaxID=259305 RepID=UPI0025925CA2|nr:alanine dehydrogenase [uncultured Kocuria sp.]MCT1366876.1 alanine dehydrogenase [Rothia sp. p3-SID1597]
MRISVVREIKPQEERVGLTPANVEELTRAGHTVYVERGAGDASGFEDEAYVRAGGELTDQEQAWARTELMIKVKEPIESEYRFLRKDLVLFTYLHLAADRPLTQALLEAGTIGIAYETVQDETGLPLLTPMSEIAGRLAIHAAARHLSRAGNGPGKLLGGAPGVSPGRVVIIGGGAVGLNAALLAIGLQAEVTVLDMSPRRIRELETLLDRRARVLMSNPAVVEEELAQADVVIGAVLVPGRAAPKVVRHEHLELLRKDALLIDVAIDQGGAFETSHPTTYEDPIFEVDGIRHYCVANMPGAVPQTATSALTNATMPYIKKIAALGADHAVESDPSIAKGVNTWSGRLLQPGVATAFPDLGTPSANDATAVPLGV